MNLNVYLDCVYFVSFAQMIVNFLISGPKYDTILFDVDSKDSSTGLSCPPESFLDPEILSAVADSLEDSGIFFLDVVSLTRYHLHKNIHMHTYTSTLIV